MMSRKSNNNCCVVGCTNTYKTSPTGTKFYSFPSEARFPGRKNLWITAVRRPKSWIPTKNSLVCSTHFIGGIKSDHPHHPGYTPTIFPEIYKCRSSESNSKLKIRRFQRAAQRLKSRRIQPDNNLHSSNNILMELDMNAKVEDLYTKSIGTNCCLLESNQMEKKKFRFASHRITSIAA